jgi:hypothetical protein
MTTTAAPAELEAIPAEELMARIAHERRAIEHAEATRGPISARRYIAAHIEPVLLPLLAEKRRRIAARRGAR